MSKIGKTETAAATGALSPDAAAVAADAAAAGEQIPAAVSPKEEPIQAAVPILGKVRKVKVTPNYSDPLKTFPIGITNDRVEFVRPALAFKDVHSLPQVAIDHLADEKIVTYSRDPEAEGQLRAHHTPKYTITYMD